MFKEIERRTVYTLLANPVRRWQFVLGKFVGLLAVLALNVGADERWRCRGPAGRAANRPGRSLPAMLLILVELAIVTAFALLFSSLTNPILAAVWTFAVYVSGHLSWSLQLLEERVPEGLAASLCRARLLAAAEPRPAEHQGRGGARARRCPTDSSRCRCSTGWATRSWSLALAAAAFERKDFN